MVTNPAFQALLQRIIVMTPLFYKYSSPLYAAGAWYFGAPKYPKRFVNPAMGLSHHLTHIKKTVALCFVFKFFF